MGNQTAVGSGMRQFWVIVLLAMLLVGSGYQQVVAEEGKRVALIVGNADYKYQSPLSNPLNDAGDVAAKLKGLGFHVIEAHDVSREELYQQVREFRGQLGEDVDVALFFYSGHGAQDGVKNYLIPVDAKLNTTEDLPVAAFDAENVLAQMGGSGSKVNVMVLDACRNLPLKSGNKGSGAKGLIRMDTVQGSLIAYATSPGMVATDGAGRNSPYTQELLKLLPQEGLTLTQLFNDVGVAVSRATQGQQVPWVSSSPLPKVCLVDCGATPPQPPAEAPPTPKRRPPHAPAPPTSQQLVGTWRFSGVELGRPIDIIWQALPDGTSIYTIPGGWQANTAIYALPGILTYGTWQYSDGIIYEQFQNGVKGKGRIDAINANHFDLTIIDNGTPAFTGLKRRYIRQ